MKTRQGFISNSSSSSFMITNKSDKTLTITDFALENRQLLDDYNDQYNGEETLGQLIGSAADRLDSSPNEYTFAPHSSKCCVFGDEEGDTIGRIYDYILRCGGNSENWSWEYKESLR
jgi:hypothetical protein